MKPIRLISIVVACAVAVFPGFARAQNAGQIAPASNSVKEVVDPLPRQLMMKLKGPSQMEGAKTEYIWRPFMVDFPLATLPGENLIGSIGLMVFGLYMFCTARKFVAKSREVANKYKIFKGMWDSPGQEVMVRVFGVAFLIAGLVGSIIGALDLVRGTHRPGSTPKSRGIWTEPSAITPAPSNSTRASPKPTTTGETPNKP